MTTAHGKVRTPAYLPCATKGAVRQVGVEDLKTLGFEIILANAYHLYLKPGDLVIKKLGGLNKFINWPRSILTDSGGFQIFSLGRGFRDKKKKKLAEIQDRGVVFRSHHDGSSHFLTPEKVLRIQSNLSSDIMMVLDDCTEYPVSYERAKKSMLRTHLWAKKSLEFYLKQKKLFKDQALFGIIQGATFQDLREQSAKFIQGLGFQGIAVGGVSVGEPKKKMYEVIDWLGGLLIKDKPHYLMGVGEPEDLIFAIKRGFDIFDCVLPTRLGRHGTVWITKNWQSFQKINLKNAAFLLDKKVIMEKCQCPTCSNGYSRAFLHHLFREKEALAGRLASIHNLYLIQELLCRQKRKIA